jgi:hypothetical protein
MIDGVWSAASNTDGWKAWWSIVIAQENTIKPLKAATALLCTSTVEVAHRMTITKLDPAYLGKNLAVWQKKFGKCRNFYLKMQERILGHHFDDHEFVQFLVS